MRCQKRASGRVAAALAGSVALCLSACGTGRSDDEVAAGAQQAQTAAITCMPRPSACGFPDATNTGVSPGVSLAPVNGAVTLDRPGEVYENKFVTGSISVKAPNVTIRNVKLKVTDEGYGIRAFGWEGDVSGLKIDHVEIDLNGFTDTKGIAFDGYTATHVWFHNGLDCAHQGNNVTIADSFCDLPKLPRGSTSHADGFQSDGGHNLVYRHNTIRNPNDQTSAILMSTNTSPITNVVIDDNLMAGGGYTVYCGTDEGGPSRGTTVYTNNIISKAFFSKGGYWGPTIKCDEVTTNAGNTWDGTRQFPVGGSGTGTPPAKGTATGFLRVKSAKTSVRRALHRRLGHRFAHARRLHVSCKRRSGPVVACNVRWHKSHKGHATWFYGGKVVVYRLSAASRRYVLRIRARQAHCGCVRHVFKASGRL
jgi:hypothetical protein